MNKIKPEIGWGVVRHDKYLINAFFPTRYQATNWAVDYFTPYSELKTWRAIKKKFGICFVKCKLEILEK